MTGLQNNEHLIGDDSAPDAGDDLSGLEPETVQEHVGADIPDQTKPPVVKIRKVVDTFPDPLSQRGFVFMIGNCAYQVYDVRSRGRRAIKRLGVIEHGNP